MKSKFITLAEQILAGTTTGPTPEGRACLKKFLSLLVVEYAYLDKKEATLILKQYDQDPKSLKEHLTRLFDEMGLNENSINDIDLFEDDGLDKVSFKKAEKWAKCLDTIVRETGIDMKDLGFPDSYTFMKYVAECLRQSLQ